MTEPHPSLPWLRETASGVLLDVHVRPGAPRTKVGGLHGHRLKVSLKSPAVDGKANAALQELVAEIFGVRLAQVSVKVGLTARDKTLVVECDDVEARARGIEKLARGD